MLAETSTRRSRSSRAGSSAPPRRCVCAARQERRGDAAQTSAASASLRRRVRRPSAATAARRERDRVDAVASQRPVPSSTWSASAVAVAGCGCSGRPRDARRLVGERRCASRPRYSGQQVGRAPPVRDTARADSRRSRSARASGSSAARGGAPGRRRRVAAAASAHARNREQGRRNARGDCDPARSAVGGAERRLEAVGGASGAHRVRRHTCDDRDGDRRSDRHRPRAAAQLTARSGGRHGHRAPSAARDAGRSRHASRCSSADARGAPRDDLVARAARTAPPSATMATLVCVDQRRVDADVDDVGERVTDADRGRLRRCVHAERRGTRRSRRDCSEADDGDCNRHRRRTAFTAAAAGSPPPVGPARGSPARSPRLVRGSDEHRIEAEPPEAPRASSAAAARSACEPLARPRGESRRPRGLGPPRSASGSTTPPTRGNDCSHTGSCTTTGVTSQLQRPQPSHRPIGGGVRKSDTTKTKLPAGSTLRRRTSTASAPAERLRR